MIKHHFLSLFFIEQNNKKKEKKMPNSIIIVGGIKETNRNEQNSIAVAIKEYFKEKGENFKYYTSTGGFLQKSSQKKFTVVYAEYDCKRFKEILDMCQKFNLNMVNLVSGAVIDVKIPKNRTFNFITLGSYKAKDVYKTVIELNNS